MGPGGVVNVNEVCSPVFAAVLVEHFFVGGALVVNLLSVILLFFGGAFIADQVLKVQL